MALNVGRPSWVFQLVTWQLNCAAIHLKFHLLANDISKLVSRWKPSLQKPNDGATCQAAILDVYFDRKPVTWPVQNQKISHNCNTCNWFSKLVISSLTFLRWRCCVDHVVTLVTWRAFYRPYNCLNLLKPCNYNILVSTWQTRVTWRSGPNRPYWIVNCQNFRVLS